MSRFDHLVSPSPDAAFSLIEQCKADASPVKVDLTPGFYRDENGEPWILPSVHRTKQFLLATGDSSDHEHSPLLGHPGLVNQAQRLVFGSSGEGSKRLASIQTIAGTGANHLGAVLLAKTCRLRTVWISDPSWVNHHEIWTFADASIERRSYPYHDPRSQGINFEGMISTLRSEAVVGDVVILHTCAHNPTGLDLSKEQWKEISSICEQKELVPFFDSAYQGFATGDLDDDAWCIRHFFQNTNLELLVAQSFSKNFGLYGERVGVLHVVCGTESSRAKTLGMLTRLSRAEVTSCPVNGARIVARILEDEDLKKQWIADLMCMSGRMKAMRRRLVEELRRLGTPGRWDHLLTDIGMFSMTGLTTRQVADLRERYHVYLLPSGRISVTGLTEYNVSHVAEAFHGVVTSTATGSS